MWTVGLTVQILNFFEVVWTGLSFFDVRVAIDVVVCVNYLIIKAAKLSVYKLHSHDRV